MLRAKDNGLIYFVSTISSTVFALLLFVGFFAVVIIKERVIKSSFSGKEQMDISFVDRATDVVKESENRVTKEYGGAKPNELFSTVDSIRSDEILKDQEKSTQSESKIKIDRAGDSAQMLRTKENLDLEAPMISSQKSVDKESGIKNDEIHDEYLSKLSSMLYSRWGNPRVSDSGKMAIVRFVINRDGSVEFKIIRSSGDQIFIDRLLFLLERIRSDGVDKPTKKLELELKFMVKE